MTIHIPASAAPTGCSFPSCGKPIKDLFADVSIRRMGGSWGNVCPTCLLRYGPSRLGLGFGQLYAREDYSQRGGDRFSSCEVITVHVPMGLPEWHELFRLLNWRADAPVELCDHTIDRLSDLEQDVLGRLILGYMPKPAEEEGWHIVAWDSDTCKLLLESLNAPLRYAIVVWTPV